MTHGTSFRACDTQTLLQQLPSCSSVTENTAKLNTAVKDCCKQYDTGTLGVKLWCVYCCTSGVGVKQYSSRLHEEYTCIHREYCCSRDDKWLYSSSIAVVIKSFLKITGVTRGDHRAMPQHPCQDLLLPVPAAIP